MGVNGAGEMRGPFTITLNYKNTVVFSHREALIIQDLSEQNNCN